MKTVIVVLILSGCITIPVTKVFKDDFGKCHVVSKEFIMFDVSCDDYHK